MPKVTNPLFRVLLGCSFKSHFTAVLVQMQLLACNVWNYAIFFQLILKLCVIEDQTVFNDNQQRRITEAFCFSAERSSLVSSLSLCRVICCSITLCLWLGFSSRCVLKWWNFYICSVFGDFKGLCNVSIKRLSWNKYIT